MGSRVPWLNVFISRGQISQRSCSQQHDRAGRSKAPGVDDNTVQTQQRSLILVTPDGRREDLADVERFGRDFSRHFGYPCVFEASESHGSRFFLREWKAFLFERDGTRIGAACFRDESYRRAALPWIFHWVWLQPDQWRCGGLTEAWPAVTAEIPNFRLQRPLSPAMQAFASKQGWDPEQGRSV